MAKLITEYVDFSSVDIITEANEAGKKFMKIKGPFLQSEVKNKNGRVYSKSLLEREVLAFNKECIEQGNAVGELDHPPTPSINLDRVSHLIESLEMDGNNGNGVAKLLDTPKGMLAQKLIEGGVKLGVSTRGVGSLDGEKVGDDFKLLTVDIVHNPSAPNAYVDGILESKEYMVEGSKIMEIAVDNLGKKYDLIERRNTEEVAILLEEFLEELRGDF